MPEKERYIKLSLEELAQKLQQNDTELGVIKPGETILEVNLDFHGLVIKIEED